MKKFFLLWPMGFMLLSSFSVSADTCRLTCTTSYTKVVDSISNSASKEDRKDFIQKCKLEYNGSWGAESSIPGYTVCKIQQSDKTEVSGYGSDVAAARKDARESCDRWFPSGDQEIRRIRNSYGSYYCEK